MNWNRKPKAVADPAQPKTLVVRGLDGLTAALAKADQLALVDGRWRVVARGGYAVRSATVVGNGVYELALDWHAEKLL